MADGSIQGAGSQPMILTPPSGGGDVAKSGKAVGTGLIGDSGKLQMMKGEKAETNSQLAHKPTLLKPKEMGVQAQASANKGAQEGLKNLGQMTKVASQEVGATMVRAQLGIQTPQDQKMFQRNADTLKASAQYVDSLNAKPQEMTRNDKGAILGGQGFDDQQIEDLLLAESDHAAFKTKVQTKHGDQYASRHQALKDMGMDEKQADMALSFTDENLEKSENRKRALKNLFKNDPTAKKMVDMGFDERQIQEMLALKGKGFPPKGSMAGNSELTKLLKDMGFGEKEAEIMLASGNPDKLKEQLMLMKKTKGFPDISNKMKSLAQSSQTLADSPKKPFLEETLKQQADIFMVLELIHEMSVEQRRSSREFRAAEYDAAKNEVMKQAGEIRKAAVMTLAADVVQGGMSIAGGVASMKGAMGGGSKSAKGPKTTSAKGATPDVEVSTPKSSGSKRSGDADGPDGPSAKKSRKSSSSREGSLEARRQKGTENHNKNLKKKQTEAGAEENKRAEGKRNEAELEAQDQKNLQKTDQKKKVTVDQDKEAAKSKAKEGQDVAEEQSNQNEIQGMNNRAMAMNTMTQGIGQVASAGFKFQASEHMALQKESEARQKTHENAAQSWSEWMQLQQDMVKTCQSKIDEISRIHFDTLKSLSRG